MIYYDRIDVSQVVDVNKTRSSKGVYYFLVLVFFI